ncbi:AAA family ATPase [Streptomyces sp. NPDC002640]
MSGAGERELVGRGRELALLDGVLEAVLEGSGGFAVTLRGEAGIGKTALLGWTTARARERGFEVLAAVGSVAEAELAFGAFHQIVWPLLRRPTAVPDRGREALECATGLRDGEPPGGVMLGGAALDLLAEASRERPLLITVDDLHWVDTSSAAVLAFLRRRISTLPVVMVSAGRDEGAAAEARGADLVHVGALEHGAAETLLRSTHPGLSEAESTRVLEEARGNPLALMELPRRLHPEPGGVLAPLGHPDGPRPLGDRLELLFTDRIMALSADAALTLLLTALGSATAWDGVAWLGSAPGLDAEAVLADIEASGLARLDDRGTLSFRHPLVSSAVISLASPQERRRAHGILAEGLDADDPRRPVHEALAAVRPDESLARRLQEAARGLARRGGDAEGAALMDRAAALSTEPGSHAERLVWAAVMSARGGRLAHAAQLVEELRRLTIPADFAPLFAFAVVYVDQSHLVDFESSFTLLPEALEALSRTGAERFDGLAEQMYFKLLLATAYTGDPRGRRALDRYADEVSPLARLCARAWRDPARTAHGVIGELEALTAAMSAEQEAGASWLLLWTASAVDAADEKLWRRSTGEHTYATTGSIAKARLHHDFLRGRWESAPECLQEAQAADALGYHCNALLFRHYYAHVLAGRGDERGLREIDERIRPAAEAARMRFVTDHLTHLGALAALAHGRAADAYRVLARLTPPGTLPDGMAWFHLPFLDLVDAAVRTGRTEEARAHVAAGRAARMAGMSPHHAFLLAAAEALAAPEEEAEARFRAAYAVPGAEQWVFPMARLRLAHGAWLRRRRRAEAAQTLRRARETFLRLDAGPWADRCAEELEAIGDPAAARDGGPAALTGQELRIARLAGTGLTNKEIGVLLQLSPRTVAAHLYKIFPKLGITSRAAISRALGDDRGHEPGSARGHGGDERGHDGGDERGPGGGGGRGRDRLPG